MFNSTDGNVFDHNHNTFYNRYERYYGIGAPIFKTSFLICVAETDEKIGIEEMVDEFVVFYVAGTCMYELCIIAICVYLSGIYLICLGQDTTANLLSFALILILKHPDVLLRYVSSLSLIFYKILFFHNFFSKAFYNYI